MAQMSSCLLRLLWVKILVFHPVTPLPLHTFFFSTTLLLHPLIHLLPHTMPYVVADIFSFGIVLCEMITKQEPSAHFLKRTPQQNCFSLPEDELRAAVLVDCPESLEALTIECCNSEPDQRPTAHDCFEWLQVRR
jgi:serine/threonine protein kinase